MSLNPIKVNISLVKLDTSAKKSANLIGVGRQKSEIKIEHRHLKNNTPILVNYLENDTSKTYPNK